jgi:hypothetical protein
MQATGTVPTMITWQDRYAEWKALLDYLSEHREELEKNGRMRALVICLQRHYVDMKRLKNILDKNNLNERNT